MAEAGQGFQVFVKPIGAKCNLDCAYCYYLEKSQLYQGIASSRMPVDILEKYISQHIQATPGDIVRFSWHGGEPTLLGVDYYKKIVTLQEKHRDNKRIQNGIQTNGTLLNDEWCSFLSKAGFAVGLSLDGPEETHNRFRYTKDHKPSFRETMHGYWLLRKYGVFPDVLCVVNALNAGDPLGLYGFYRDIGARYVSFLPLVDSESRLSVSSVQWGEFLCTIFDEWLKQDIGLLKVQIFEEALRVAFNQEHSLCIFRPTCGDVLALEHNGDLYSCDHFVDRNHLLGNIMDSDLVELMESRSQRRFGENKWVSLPKVCLGCEVLEFCYGECPKNRFICSPGGESGLNYLCSGYKRFFSHAKPFIEDVSALWKSEKNLT